MSRALALVALLGVYATVRVSLSLLTAAKRLAEAQAFTTHADEAIALTRQDWSAYDLDFAEDEGIDLGCLYFDTAHKPEAI